ncbi:VRR-NUC domain-containing protein [Aromatoleum evansii]|uniref:VRR-NUC domain-containing protein n=1 Tax=Aromatoleum evansii TaxID=59406 RepID=A0ABZ1AJI6_AROEV|nr:VRR-NUC domain-containing protein [Aromatoleum evansii]
MQSDFLFSFHTDQRERFRDGTLVRDWRRRYPQIFDEDDERVLNTEHQRRYHFFEWLSAVLLFEATGYISLVEKYTSKSHPNKRKTLQQILTPKTFQWLCENESGQPDLFVFQPVTKDWFFCEVKGGSDRIRQNQIEWMDRFGSMLTEENISSNGKMRVLSLQEVNV